MHVPFGANCARGIWIPSCTPGWTPQTIADKRKRRIVDVWKHPPAKMNCVDMRRLIFDITRARNYQNDKFVAVGDSEAETSVNLILFTFEAAQLYLSPPLTQTSKDILVDLVLVGGGREELTIRFSN